ncbi:unnamed protein product [Heligmosomoides polygyrus]|uniref:Transposase n=1 Tax=Heligmosomoides polygyrus TaxID=6339 RepID=A0A3P8EVR7_HELPZ|nr:unnamed protein product [Heligmosomoides polygyrus]
MVATLNPAIYCKYNKDFRIPFREMLACRCATLQHVMRQQSFTSRYGPTVGIVREILKTVVKTLRIRGLVIANAASLAGVQPATAVSLAFITPLTVIVMSSLSPRTSVRRSIPKN